MKKLIKTVIYFIAPIILIMGVLYYIDPYNIIRRENNPKLKELKELISYKINYSLYKIQDYYWNPTDVIVLGDSRANHLSEKSFEKLTGEKVKNLAYGGGSIQEVVETFWTVNEIHTLKKVYIGLNFNLYNALNTRNNVEQTNSLRKSTASYLSSKYCIKASFLMLKSIITNEKIEIEKPPYSREDFWKYQLNISGPIFFKNYEYPSKYYTDLKLISDYCLSHNISLIFFIPPIHTDLQEKVIEYHLEKEYEQFKLDLASLSVPVYDFNYVNDMTKNKQNFGDPFHFQGDYEEIIINVISSNSKEAQPYNKDVYKLLGNL